MDRNTLRNAPDIFLQARDILHEMYYPYFSANKTHQVLTDLQKPKDGQRDWRPVEGQHDNGKAWYNCKEMLHEMAEVFCASVLSEHVVSTIPSNM